jgi:hypothetical protein
MEMERQAKELDYGNPFHHTAIISVLRDEHFQKPSSFGNVHIDSFVSAHANRPEPELPDAMVAVVATAVCHIFSRTFSSNNLLDLLCVM